MKRVNEATSPPNIKPNDPGILTRSQYLNMRNPSGKMHPSDAYQSSIKSLNYGIRDVSTKFTHGESDTGKITAPMSDLVYINKNHNDDFRAIIYSKDTGRSGDVGGVIYKGVAHYSPDYLSNNQVEALEKFPYVKSVKPTKYPKEFYDQLINKLAVIENKKEYGKPLSRF